MRRSNREHGDDRVQRPEPRIVQVAQVYGRFLTLAVWLTTALRAARRTDGFDAAA